jgi:hypothetical protein
MFDFFLIVSVLQDRAHHPALGSIGGESRSAAQAIKSLRR